MSLTITQRTAVKKEVKAGLTASGVVLTMLHSAGKGPEETADAFIKMVDSMADAVVTRIEERI